ncbi:hypothetical protein [Nocardioides ochotonae]|uniref:hypothetical protein n=1 Tax=Nocardioides ochotonae TaxID=2685869 RepID=UPI00140E3044|nr:hypothetical protein [Nocardioides ochotonae]
MAEAIVFPDPEALLVTHLRDALGVRVVTRVPNPRPDRFVRVVRVGGNRRNLVTDSAMVVVEAWAPDDVAASELARLARAYVGALEGETVGGAFTRRVTEVAGPQNLPDPTSATPRYVFTVALDLRGDAL